MDYTLKNVANAFLQFYSQINRIQLKNSFKNLVILTLKQHSYDLPEAVNYVIGGFTYEGDVEFDCMMKISNTMLEQSHWTAI